MKIVVDGMGGDDAPQVIVDGACQAAEELPDDFLEGQMELSDTLN